MWGLAFSLLLLALIPHWAAAGLAFIGATVSFTFVAPALLICQQEIVPAEWRAVMSGTIVTARGLGTAAIAFGGGHLITAVGYQGLFLTGAALAVLGAAFFWTYTWLPRWLLTHRRIVGSTLEP
jgi:predicted MFS family arabinose efflux permease